MRGKQMMPEIAEMSSIKIENAGPINIVIVIPAYNEARFIGSVVLQASEFGTVIVVDDGSSDHTALIAANAGATVLRHEVNLGKSEAINTGFDYAKTLKADVFVMMDGDGQHLCGEIPTVIAPILKGEADIVVGSRFLQVKSRIPRWRVFGQHALTMATNLSSGFHLTDSQSGFRAFSPLVVASLNFDTQGFSIESEMQFLAKERGLRISEVPISVLYAEPSKRNPFNQGLQVLNGIVRLVSQHRPLFFFGGGGLVVLLLGLIWGGYVVDIYSRLHVLAVGYTLISVLLTIIGASALFTGLMLNSLIVLMKDIKKSVDRLRKR
jgi:glycosyltransferase involved in cell wall biosynthesis